MQIFLSYRRSDFSGHAHLFIGRLADALTERFGENSVYYDIESTPHGEDFEKYIHERIAQADVVLAVIGPDWLTLLQQRTSEAVDYVRVELQAAIQRDKHLIPLLVDETAFPSPESLPASIAELSSKQEFRMRTQRDFNTHIDKLSSFLSTLPDRKIISGGEFQATRENIADGSAFRFLVHNSGGDLTFGDVLERWETDEAFRDFFQSLITGSGFSGYIFETPPVSSKSLGAPFEFVVISKPTPYSAPDRDRYAKYFQPEGGDAGVVTFLNLGGDVLLVVPSPTAPDSDYSTLATFFQNAPSTQHHALWRTVGRSAKERLSDKGLWISVAGGGVYWLHVRLDPVPKYYSYAPYRNAPIDG